MKRSHHPRGTRRGTFCIIAVPMKVLIPKEMRPGERRVALAPDTVKKLVASGFSVVAEAGAGLKLVSPTPTLRPPAPP